MNHTKRFFVIDQSGTIHQHSGDGRWGLPEVDEELMPISNEMLVEKHGFTCITVGAGALVHVNVASISPLATAALLFLIADLGIDRMAVAYFRDVWSYRVFSQAAHGINHIAKELDNAKFSPGKHLRKRRLPLSEARRWTRLNQLLHSVANSTPIFNPRLQATVKDLTSGHYLFATSHPDRNRLLVHDLGKGYSVFPPDWSDFAKGRPIHEQPDYDYGIWLRAGYFDVLAESIPVLDEVDAVVYRPDQGRRRYTYARVTIPLHDDVGNSVVLSASVLDVGIDLSGLTECGEVR